ncbi:BTAD domain-containing putative transcriptional regulator [Pseudokineococcus sp. 5B2Z-1]|uniref:BTAD domain-containing putative transcriptional regulator n=1 Tax=Pseudokineococcus sp. 5B2Z-1 TaxID=3132744 RepID=UPI0030A0F002
MGASGGVAAPAAPGVRLRLLGPLAVEVDGRGVELGGPRRRALLARLALARGAVVSADRLVHDVWSGEPPPTALAALQVQVSHLRRALEPGRARRAPARVLVSAPPGYLLALPRAAVDAWRFEDLLADAADQPPAEARHRLDEALGCWSGDALAEVRDAGWARPEADRLEELRATALERRAAASLALGAPADAVAAMAWLVHDQPAREGAVGLLALGHYRAGRQGEALAVLRAARAHLADELGVDPGPALRALEAAVLAQDAALDGPVGAVVVPGPPTRSPSGPAQGDGGGHGREVAGGHGREGGAGERPAEGRAGLLVGRAAEEAALVAAAERVRVGGAAAAWLEGEAGEGKTTLAEAVGAALAARGWALARGRCPEAQGAPPGWAWSQVLEQLDVPGAPSRHGGAPTGGAPTDGAAAEGTAAEGTAAGLGAGTPFALSRALATALAAAAARAPVVVLLEDAHRADDLTLALLRHGLAELGDAPVLVVVTLRLSEAPADLVAVRAALAGRTAGHVDLAGLPRAAVAQLAGAEGVEELDGASLDLLVERTGGNPLFVRELARLVAAGDPAALGRVPRGVADVLRWRLARLPAPALAVLRQASVLGREVDLAVLAATTGRDEDELADALEPAVLAGVVDEPAPGRLRFSHVLLRDVLHEDLPRLRRTRLHAAAVEVLERSAPHELEALAHHASAGLTAATAERALRHATAAARAAEAVGAAAVAGRRYAEAVTALDLSGRAESGEAVRARARAVRHLARAGDAVRARALQREAVVLAGGDDELLAEAVLAWDAPLVWSVREARQPDAVLVGAVERLLRRPLPDLVRGQVLCALVREVEGEDVPAAAAAADEALALARRCCGAGADVAAAPPRAGPASSRAGEEAARLLCSALGARAYVALGPDLAGERDARARELLAAARAHRQADHEAVGHWFAFLAAAARADLAGAGAALEEAVRRSAAGQLGPVLRTVDFWRASLDVVAGRLPAAARRYARGAARMAADGAPNAAIMDLLGRVAVGLAGDGLAAEVEELLAADRASGGALARVVALALADAGRVDEARERLAAARPVARDYYWLALTALRARAAARLEDRAAARACYDELLPWAGRVAGLDSGSLPVGPVDAALAGCADVLGDGAAADAHRAAAAQLLRHLGRGGA